MERESATRSVFEIPITYSGLLDDVVHRHSITPEMNADFFNRSIIRSVFCSGRMFINDGYLVNNPSALRQILKEGSLLRTMIRNDFVRVLSRQPDADSFARNPEKMAERGVETFKILTDRSDWLELRASLHNWAEGLFAYNKFEPWPNFKMEVGFRKLFRKALAKDVEGLGLDGLSPYTLDEFHKQYEGHAVFLSAPRTAVESVLLNMRKLGQIGSRDVVGIMNIANQCYHYNFAMCLDGKNNKRFVAETTTGIAFQDILQADEARAISADDLAEIRLRKFPVLSIPKGFPIDNARIFDEIIDPQSGIARAKHEYMEAVERLLSPKSNEPLAARHEELAAKTVEYRHLLEKHFAKEIKIADWAPRRGAMINFGLSALTSKLNTGKLMLAANMIGGPVSSFVHRITKRVSEKITEAAVKIAFNPNAGEEKLFTFEAGEIPRFCCIPVDDKHVADHVRDLPRMDPRAPT